MRCLGSSRSLYSQGSWHCSNCELMEMATWREEWGDDAHPQMLLDTDHETDSAHLLVLWYGHLSQKWPVRVA
jgi:hypothetical protein